MITFLFVFDTALLMGFLSLFVWAISTDERNVIACDALRRIRRSVRK